MLPFLSIGSIQIPSYFLIISIGFCLATFYLYKRAEKYNLSTSIAMDFGLALMLGSFLGARLFHVIYEEPQYYLEEPWALFWVWQGGFVFYGGLAGSLALGVSVLIWRKQNVIVWLDALSIVFPPIYALGRFATLLSGSGYGKPTELPWGIIYPSGSEAPAGVLLHPTPIYSILWCLGLWLILILIEKRKPKAGQLFLSLVVGYGLGRLIIEQFRNDPRGAEFFSLSISSWISISLLVLALFVFIYRQKSKSKVSQ